MWVKGGKKLHFDAIKPTAKGAGGPDVKHVDIPENPS